MHGVSNVPATLPFHGGKALGCAILRGALAAEGKGGLRSSRSSAGRGPLAASSRNSRPRNCTNYLRSNRGSDRGLRDLARGDSLLRKVRLRDGGEGGVYAGGKGRLRTVPYQSHALQ